MDQQLLKELARFKMLLRRTANHSTDIEKLLSDRVYAKEVLTLAEESDSIDLVVMALDLKDKLGLLPKAAEPAKPEEKPKDDDDDKKDKYVFGARG